MAEMGLQEVDNRISRLQNMFAQIIATRTIMDLCLAAERIQGQRISKRSWEQDGVDVEGMQTAAREADQREEEEDTDGMETDKD